MPFRFLCSVMLGNGPFLNPREVMPLAVLRFENTVLVASCAFLLKLCGLSASMLHVDVASLRRISSFYKSTNYQVGFLTEAQTSVFPFDMVIQVASKEFTDPRLNIHIIIVLKIMQLSKEKASSTNSTPTGNGNEMTFRTESNTIIPMELFGLLAECEKRSKRSWRGTSY